MKRVPLVAAATLALCASLVAQPNIGGPVQLHNPHRRGGSLGAAPDDAGVVGAPTRLPPGEEMPGKPPTEMPPPPPVTMIADGSYLFILRGDTLMQFDKKTLRLLNSVELPRPALPAQDDIRTHTGPPLRPTPGVRFSHPAPAF